MEEQESNGEMVSEVASISDMIGEKRRGEYGQNNISNHIYSAYHKNRNTQEINISKSTKLIPY